MYGDQVRPLFAGCNPEIYFASRTTNFVYLTASQNQAAKFIVRQAPRVNFIATLPGAAGINTAFAAEFGIAMGLMVSVLQVMRLAKLSRYTGLIAGSLVALFITFEAPLSGMSMNPARSFASAVTGHSWQHFWLYCTAPVLGMQTAALCFLPLRRYLKCAKLIHRSKHRCIHCGQK